MNAGLFHHDSVQLAKSIEGNIDQAVGGREGVTLLYSIPYLFGASAENSATLMTILFGALSVVMVFFIICNLFNVATATLTASMFAMCPLFVSVATYAKSHTIALFFALLSLYLLIKFLREDNWIYGLLFSLSFIASLFMRVDNILYVIVFVYVFFFINDLIGVLPKYYKHKYKLKNMLSIIIPLVSFFFLNLNFGWIFKYSMDKPVLELNKLLFLGTIGSMRLIASLGYISFICFIIFLLFLFKEREDDFLIFCGIWFASIFFPMIIMNVASARFFLGALIPLYLIIARGISKSKGSPLTIILLGIILFGMMFQIIPLLEYRSEHCAGKDLAYELDRVMEDNAVVMLEDESVFAEYYAGLEVIYPTNITNRTTYVPSFIVDSFNLNLSLEPVSIMVYEDYHHAELKLKTKNITIYRVIK